MKRGITAFGLGLLTLIFAVQLVPAQTNYTWQDATAESFWYSIYNVDALISSGMGMTLEGQEAVLERIRTEAGFTQSDDPPLFNTPIFLPYDAGDPKYVQSSSQKWLGNTRDEVIYTSDVAWMIIAYTTQAKQLERLYQIGVDQSSTIRFQAMLRGILASEAANYVYSNMRDPVSDLYLSNSNSTDSDYTLEDQSLMLWALAELTSLTDGYAFYRGGVSRFESELWASDLFQAINSNGRDNPEWLDGTIAANAQFINSLAAFAATVGSASMLEKAVDMIHSQAVSLAELPTDAGPSTTPAIIIRALITAQQMTGDDSFGETAISHWNAFQSRWDADLGFFNLSGDNTAFDMSTAEVADLVGAFGALINVAGLEDYKTQFADFFEQVLKNSRMMNSEGEEAGSEFDNDAVPSSEDAGGPFGTAPVFVGRVQYDPGANDWFVTNSLFETDGAMYLASQLMWIGQRDRQPYVGPPAYGIPLSREAQFIGLQKQIEQLRNAGVGSGELDGIRTLLQNVETEIDVLKTRQLSIPNMQNDVKNLLDQVDSLESRLGNLENRVSSVASAISNMNVNIQNIGQNSSKPQTNSGDNNGPVTTENTVAVILIIFLLLIAFVAYQWVTQRKPKETE